MLYIKFSARFRPRVYAWASCVFAQPGDMTMKRLIGVAMALVATPVLAQTTTQAPSNADPIQAICSGFLAENSAGVSADKVKLCSCLVRETKSRLSVDEMKSYSQANLNGQAPSDAVMQKVIAIAQTCLTEAK